MVFDDVVRIIEFNTHSETPTTGLGSNRSAVIGVIT